jgi:hypothetical protein
MRQLSMGVLVVLLYAVVSGEVMAAPEATSTTGGKTEASVSSPQDQIAAAKRLQRQQQNIALAGRQTGGIAEPETDHQASERVTAVLNPVTHDWQ